MIFILLGKLLTIDPKKEENVQKTPARIRIVRQKIVTHSRQIVCSIFLLILISASSLSAQDRNPRDTAGRWEFGGSGGLAASGGVSTPLYGLNIAWSKPRLFADAFGMGVYGGILTAFIRDENTNVLSNMLVVLDFLAGPGYVLYQNDRLTVPLAVGFYYDFTLAMAGSHVMNMGLGANISAQWRFSQRWYAYFRLQAAYAFFGGGEFLPKADLGFGRLRRYKEE
jgi:hypothetical protein